MGAGTALKTVERGVGFMMINNHRIVFCARTARRRVAAHGLKENVAALPAPGNVKKITFPAIGHSIEPMPGKMASVAIYAHLAGGSPSCGRQYLVDVYMIRPQQSSMIVKENAPRKIPK